MPQDNDGEQRRAEISARLEAAFAEVVETQVSQLTPDEQIAFAEKLLGGSVDLKAVNAAVNGLLRPSSGMEEPD